VSKGDPFGTVEAVKTVEEIYAPVTGEVVDINGSLDEKPELVNQSAFAEGWLVRIKMSDPSELEELMDAESYQAMVGE
jgi:glycine cleavage system H protein